MRLIVKPVNRCIPSKYPVQPVRTFFLHIPAYIIIN